jgi:anti-sigma28 factor (negative regulator of flagellin synthesis)
MNAKHLIAAVTVLAATGSVLAQEFVEPGVNFVSTRTRAEVVAELKQAQADGTYLVLDTEYPIIKQAGTPRTRAEVLAELKQAQDDGSYYVNDVSYPVIPTATASRSRDEVRTELDAHRKAHPFGQVDSRYGS